MQRLQGLGSRCAGGDLRARLAACSCSPAFAGRSPLAIVIGSDNIYTIPEFYPPSAGGMLLPVDGKNLGHAAAHVVFAGALLLPLVTWALSSLFLVVARKMKK